MGIQHIERETKGFFKAVQEEKEVGKMTYTRAGSTQLIIDHTEVRPELKGMGVGKQLVMAAVDYAQENKIRIIPLCPFAKAVFDRTEEIRDVLKSATK